MFLFTSKIDSLFICEIVGIYKWWMLIVRLINKKKKIQKKQQLSICTDSNENTRYKNIPCNDSLLFSCNLCWVPVPWRKRSKQKNTKEFF